MADIVIYSDGGCSPNPGLGGWAAVLISPKHKAEKTICGAEAESTNNRMELTAAIEALKTLKRPCKVEFHTDSQYLKNAFTNGWIAKWLKNNWKTAGKKPVKNKDLWLELIELEKIHKIQWNWIKGHSGDKYNEICDSLVLKAREDFKRAQR
ncbi:MAG: ribonuclease HI [Phycisphaerae bacterium]|jgi:ribonuclease HI